MLNVSFLRRDYEAKCDGCCRIIEAVAPRFEIELGVAEKKVCLCEDCGNDLQNDMADSYHRFVDLML